MKVSEIQKQVDSNYEAFQCKLSTILESHRGKFALMRDREIVEFFDTARDAYVAGGIIYEDGLFSLQEVTDRSVRVFREALVEEIRHLAKRAYG